MSNPKQIANAHPLPPPSFDDDDDLLEFTRLAEDVSQSDKKKSVTSDRKRKRFSFWLEFDKSEQFHLGQWIKELRVSRQFAPVIRTALSLYQQLLAGETYMLYQLFPDVKPPPPIITPEKIKEMEKEISNLRIQVDILIKQQSPNAVDYGVKMAGQGAPKKMLTNNVAAPVIDDDDDLVIRRDESSGARAAENFIKSAFALNGMPSPVSKQ